MGSNSSSLPQVDENFQYFTLTFCQSDKIFLTFANKNVIRIVRQAASVHWTPGIAFEDYVPQRAFEIRLREMPFNKHQSKEMAVQVKKMCCQILADLYTLGWTLMVSSDLSRYTDLTTWFFQRLPRIQNSPAPIITCVSLSSTDCLQLVNGDDQLKVAFRQAVTDIYGQRGDGITGEHVINGEQGEYELRLIGHPWSSSNFTEGVRARKVLLSIFRHFDRASFNFYGTANLKGTVDCIFFISNERFIIDTDNSCQYAMLSLNRNDRLRLIDCTERIVDTVRRTIADYLIPECEHYEEEVLELRLKGYPWSSTDGEAVTSRFLITILLENLSKIGWTLVTTLDISRRLNDKCVFVLKYCRPMVDGSSDSAARRPHFCISLNEVNKIRLINASQDMQTNFGHVIRQYWPWGIKMERDYFRSHEIKLGGAPWQGRSFGGFGDNQYLIARCLMCFVLKMLVDNGWRVVCSADVSSKCYEVSNEAKGYSIDVHSWFVAPV